MDRGELADERTRLADALDEIAKMTPYPGTKSIIARSAQALRRQPSVEEVARKVLAAVHEGFEHGQCEPEWEPAWANEIATRAARQIAALYQGKGEG